MQFPELAGQQSWVVYCTFVPCFTRVSRNGCQKMPRGFNSVAAIEREGGRKTLKASLSHTKNEILLRFAFFTRKRLKREEHWRQSNWKWKKESMKKCLLRGMSCWSQKYTQEKFSLSTALFQRALAKKSLKKGNNTDRHSLSRSCNSPADLLWQVDIKIPLTPGMNALIQCKIPGSAFYKAVLSGYVGWFPSLRNTLSFQIHGFDFLQTERGIKGVNSPSSYLVGDFLSCAVIDSLPRAPWSMAL